MANDEIVTPIQGLTKQCSTCDKVRPLDDFWVNRGGRASKCKDCHASSRRKKFVTDPPQHGQKICYACKECKDYASFCKNKWQSDGYDGLCKKCTNERNKKRQKEKREKVRQGLLPRPVKKIFKRSDANSFGSKKTAAQVKAVYNDAYELQMGVCAICGQPETGRNQHGVRRLSIDHCHVSGEFRGLLCSKCNLGLGYFKDDPKLLENAILYLQRDNSAMNV